MYYIEKEGVYNQGVFWIGDDLYEGVRELLNLTYKDEDDYHHWCIKEYEVGNQCTTIVEITKHTFKEHRYQEYEVLTTANGSANVYLGSRVIKHFFKEHYTLTQKGDGTC